MDPALQTGYLGQQSQSRVSLARGAAWGVAGGVAGTAIMDLVLMAGLSAVGLPALTCFSIVGDTVARFLPALGVEVAGGAPLGVITHYLIGPAVGVTFGAAMARLGSQRERTRIEYVVRAIVYVEILAQPLLAMTPIFLAKTASWTLMWFGLSFAMHFMMAAVLGGVVGYGLRPTNASSAK